MAKPKVNFQPEGYHTASPYLVIRNATKAIEFYQKAFGADVRFTMPGPGGALMHAEIQIGDSVLMLCDENPEWGMRSPQSLNGTASSVLLYVKDVDKTFTQAIAAGGKEIMAPQDQFWGDRMAKVSDPFGHEWGIATHIEDVPPEEMGKRAQAAFAKGC